MLLNSDKATGLTQVHTAKNNYMIGLQDHREGSMTTTQAIIMTITPVLFVAIGLAMIYWPKKDK
ncbi:MULTISPECIES: hypothetical protein [Pseudidiomarina]|uniref:Uncharacterized protein n=2 Tax=Pseudidiomarina TaxID=2800384 RepID=A0A368UKC9_9GAMM|nr:MULTISPECIES: hypothetical protein [Pseudidiomarina]PWW09305.1 hypothetical protein DET45_12042 [Pseudidiomarina maritima]RBP87235.1 hypothetical protein DFO81_12242 [Pseudidiomarina tainanensis]RCW29178.1 hypothetical protein DFO79_12242 [Pseudidiomarina tainanensis]